MEMYELQNLSKSFLFKYPIIQTYNELIKGKIKALPPGTWQKDENVIILIRFVLEVKLGLSEDEISKINKSIFKENKLWGALNRFKSIHKLIHFVYPERYHECDFNRVPKDYWSDINNIKERFEWRMEQANLLFQDIPDVISYDLLIKWGFSNPLKRHGDSPFRLLDAMYPNYFKATDFKKTPQRFRQDTAFLREQLLDILKKENIDLKDVPQKVTQKLLYRYRLSGVLSYYSSSISNLFCSLFPENFTKDVFIKSNGHWNEFENARNAIKQLLMKENVSEKDIPIFLTKKKLKEKKLSGLLHRYNGSPIEIVQALYPGKFSVIEFQRVPNRYWYIREHRMQALRDFCEKNRIKRDEIPGLNRAYFRKHFPRFISLADRHYESKFYLWIIESFPEYQFDPEEFQLLVGEDGQVCDSREELVLHNFFINYLSGAKVKREAEHFLNNEQNEKYIPDWIIEQNGKKYIIEYFGLYGSDLYPGYSEKTKRKIEYYPSLEQYRFIAIFPEDFKEEGFGKLVKILKSAKLQLKSNKNLIEEN